SAFMQGAELEEILSATRRNGSTAMIQATTDACRTRLMNICHPRTRAPEEMLLVQATSYAIPDRLSYYLSALDGVLQSDQSRSHRVPERLEEITVPTLVVWGADDVRGSLDRHVDAVRRIPHAALEVIDETGHLPYLENPGAFHERVLAFLDRAVEPAAS